ncbi:MAG: dienelactone hydrolase family protein [Pseudomonadota bacterium]
MRALLALLLVLTTGGTVLAEDYLLGKDVRLEVFRPDSQEPVPAVLLLHGCGGLTPKVREGLMTHAKAFNQAGFAAVLVDSFGPRGRSGGEVCESLEALRYARFYRLDDAFAAKDFVANLPGIDPRHLFLMGQSNGGSVALLAAQQRAGAGDPFTAVAAYYPWCGALADVPELVSPLLVFGAGRDGWVPPAACEVKAGAARGGPLEVVIYPEALHSFDLPIPAQDYAGQRVGGDPAAAADSRARMIAFFKAAMGR